MTPAYLTALRQSIRTCAKSAKSAKSPPGTPLIALNTLFAHPEPSEKTTASLETGQSNDTRPTAECSQTAEAEAAQKAQKAQKGPSSYEPSFAALERRCPDLIEAECWQQAVEDGRRFLASWGEQAEALGWTSKELFGLHPVPAKPHPSFARLARYGSTGLVWLLHGRPVVGMTADSAVIRTVSGGAVVYRKNNKPALGPLGDCFDDMGAA
jgi:hypothetical protein